MWITYFSYIPTGIFDVDIFPHKFIIHLYRKLFDKNPENPINIKLFIFVACFGWYGRSVLEDYWEGFFKAVWKETGLGIAAIFNLII